MDLTTTDFIAAFLLAGQLQHCRRHRTIRAILHPSPPSQNHNSSHQPSSSEDAAYSREFPTTDGLHGSIRESSSSGYESVEHSVRMPPVRQRRPTLEGRATEIEGAFSAVNNFVRQSGRDVPVSADAGAAVHEDSRIELIKKEGLGSRRCALDSVSSQWRLKFTAGIQSVELHNVWGVAPALYRVES